MTRRPVMTRPMRKNGAVVRRKFYVGGDEPPVRKMVQLRADQAQWLEAEAYRCQMSEAQVIRQLIEAAMMEVQG